MPEWIYPSELLDYFKYTGYNLNSLEIKLRKLLQITYFFQNFESVNLLIYNEIIPNLNNENALAFLEDSHLKLSIKNSNSNLEGVPVDQVWFDLFVSSLNFVAFNFLFYLTNKFDNIIALNKLLIEEVIEK